ncbi:MAG: PBP1A family penicillin-binding protein [Deltaproteobacteria bacterium]|nr:PBP1A family penicillin-binding protein [Deltaproteobacteria bacterium]
MNRRQPKRGLFSRFGRFVRQLVLTLVVLGAVGATAAVAVIYWEVTSTLPPLDQIGEYHPPMATQVFADDGTLIGELYVERRYLTPIEQIPVLVRNAFIAAEDEAFYRHRGVDLVSILRALLNNLASGAKLQGGSTITQQVVKSLLLTPQKSYTRKLREMVLAVRLERQLSKDEILHLYLNHIYLGSGAYGVAAAAQEYFGKPLHDLSVAEAALLAGLPQAPSRYSPFRHWPQAKARQRYVLDRLYAAGLITAGEREGARRAPLALAPRRGSYLAAPDYVEHIRRLLEERYGESAPYQLGLKVYTPVNVAMQAAAETALRDGLRELDARERYQGSLRHLTAGESVEFLRQQAQALGDTPLLHRRTYEAVVSDTRNGIVRVKVAGFQGLLQTTASDGKSAPVLAALSAGDVVRVQVAAPGQGADYRFVLDQSPLVEGALVALEPSSGAVKAMVGGYDWERSQFNRVVQAARQPGSAFKPLVYAAALDHNYTPASIVVDGPISFADNSGVWAPHNYENKFFGPTTLRDALAFSRNVVTVKITVNMGLKYLLAYLQQLGLNANLQPNLSVALGSAEVTPLELATTYAVFANQGLRPEPIFISKIIDSEGNTLAETAPQLRQVIAPATAYQITSMLQDVIRRGTGKKALELERPAAGKTGTTNDFMDAWFVGYTPQLLAGVWVGFDEKRELGAKETGGRVAAPIWTRFMQRALEGQPILDFSVPEGLACVPIDPHSGQRVRFGGAALLECFKPGSEPGASQALVRVADEAPAGAAPAPAVLDFFRSED